MNIRLWLANPSSLRVLNKVLIASVAVSVALSGYWSVKLGLATLSDRNNRADAKATLDTITKLRGDLASAEKLDAAPEYNGLQPVVQLQAAIEQAASQRNCELADFQASQDVAPYISRFQLKSDASEWLQIEIKLTLRGDPGNIIEALREVASGPCLVEFNGIDLARDEGKVREGAVQAKVEMRVLTKQVGAKA